MQACLCLAQLPSRSFPMYGDWRERQSASVFPCLQSKKSAEQAGMASQQLVKQANRKAMDAEAAAERYSKQLGFLPYHY